MNGVVGERLALDRGVVTATSPRVSCVVPTYNRVGLLQQAVDSILDQKFTDYELIVCDNNSLDETPDYMRGLADGRIKYIRNRQNFGQTVNMNVGLQAARGEYVAILHDDDKWDPAFLSATTEILDGNRDVAFVSTNHFVIGADGRILPGLTSLFDQRFGRASLRRGRLTMWTAAAMTTQPFALIASVFRRRDLARIGFLDVHCDLVADFDLFVRLSLEPGLAFYVPDRLAFYRVHANQVSRAQVSIEGSRVSTLERYRFGDDVLERVRRQELARAYARYGFALLWDNRPGEAWTNFTSSLALRPVTTKAWIGLGALGVGRRGREIARAMVRAGRRTAESEAQTGVQWRSMR